MDNDVKVYSSGVSDIGKGVQEVPWFFPFPLKG